MNLYGMVKGRGKRNRNMPYAKEVFLNNDAVPNIGKGSWERKPQYADTKKFS